MGPAQRRGAFGGTPAPSQVPSVWPAGAEIFHVPLSVMKGDARHLHLWHRICLYWSTQQHTVAMAGCNAPLWINCEGIFDMAKPRLVLIGNGMAGMRTVEELLALEPDMYDITVLGEDRKSVV